jgi:hypothetical protein
MRLRKDFEDLSDEELMRRLREQADAFLLEQEAKMAAEDG